MVVTLLAGDICTMVKTPLPPVSFAATEGNRVCPPLCHAPSSTELIQTENVYLEN